MYRYSIRPNGTIAVVTKAHLRELPEGFLLMEAKRYYDPLQYFYDKKTKAFVKYTEEQQYARSAKKLENVTRIEKDKVNAVKRLKTAVASIEDPQVQKAFIELGALLKLQLETKKRKKS